MDFIKGKGMFDGPQTGRLGELQTSGPDNPNGPLTG